MSRPDLPEHLRTEELYRSAVELAPDSIITVDMKGVITSSNTAATRILGYSKDELVGRHFSKIGVVRARDVPKFLRLFKSAVRGELVEPLELTFYRKDGPAVLAEVRVGLLKENGKTIGLQAVSRDITKRRQAEEALRESEERLSVFMDSAPDAFALFDSELNLVEINRVGLGMFPDGSKKEGVIGKNIAELYPTMKETGRYDKYLEVVETGKSFFVDDVVAHPRFGEGHLTVRAFKVGEGLGLIVTDITERKRAQEDLQRLKQFNEGIVQGVAEGILIEDESGLITFVNPGLEALLGHTSDELVGRHCETIVPEEEVELVQAKTSLRPDGVGDQYETRLLAKDGCEIPVIVSARPLFREGTFAGVISAFTDIAERKQAEEEIKQLHEYLQLQIDRMPIGFIVWDTEFQVQSWNPAAEKIFGFTAQEALGKHPYDLIVPKEAQPHVDDIWNRLLKGDMTAYSINDNTTKDGRTIVCDWANTPLKEADGTVVGVLSMVQDITERKRAEEALRESEERYRTILENIEEGYFEVDIAGNFTFFNDSLCRIIGYSRDEMMGMNNRQYMDKENAKKVFQAFNRVHTTGKPTKGFDWEIVRKDGTRRFVEASISLTRNSKGEPSGFRGTVRDITERKRAEKGLEHTLEKLRKALGATIQAMALTVEAKDAYTAGHQQRSTNLARTIATKMGLSEEQIDGIRMAGVIHDIGKISVPGEILSKPGRLTDIEFSLIKTHAQVGYDILKPIEFPWPVAQIVLQHHERIDGSGYPEGLKSDEIMLEARILAVADVVEAMCSHRPYRPAHSIDEALEEIRQNRGVLYDPEVVDACLSLISDEGFKL